jgi:hypothetical protein
MGRRNPLVAFYIRSCIAGFVLAAVFTAALIWLDVAHIGHLVTHVEGGYLAAFLLWFFNGIVFSGAQTSVAVLLMAERRDGGRGGTPLHNRGLTPVRVSGDARVTEV